MLNLPFRNCAEVTDNQGKCPQDIVERNDALDSGTHFDTHAPHRAHVHGPGYFKNVGVFVNRHQILGASTSGGDVVKVEITGYSMDNNVPVCNEANR